MRNEADLLVSRLVHAYRTSRVDATSRSDWNQVEVDPCISSTLADVLAERRSAAQGRQMRPKGYQRI